MPSIRIPIEKFKDIKEFYQWTDMLALSHCPHYDDGTIRDNCMSCILSIGYMVDQVKKRSLNSKGFFGKKDSFGS